jgi:putative hydrolase
MIDLHTHTILSDGELLPSELIRRAQVKGYKVIGISDHVDASNLETTIAALIRLREEAEYYSQIIMLPGVEITHVPKRLIGPLTERARKLGALYVVVHGETLVEPVEAGTNREAIIAGVDILAHPGLITEEDVSLAKDKNVFLEITARKGHSLSNGHVAKLASAIGAPLIYNTDSHSPSDLTPSEVAKGIVMGSGLTSDDFLIMQKNALSIVKRVVEAIA